AHDAGSLVPRDAPSAHSRWSMPQKRRRGGGRVRSLCRWTGPARAGSTGPMPNVETGAPPYGLAVFNQLDAARAREELLACCASRACAERVAAGRPYSDTDALAAEAGRVLAELPWDDVLEALDAHPRIGERPRGPGREAAWSRREQAGTAHAHREGLEALAAGHAAYEERFAHVDP